MCNITIRCFRTTTVGCKSNKYYIFEVCVFSLLCLAYMMRAPYCHLWPVPLYSILPNYLINGTIFEKKFWDYWDVCIYNVWFDYLYNFCLKDFSILKEMSEIWSEINPLKPELNPICYLLALLGAHHFLHVSRIRVKLLTSRLLMSYIYGAPILDVSRSHTTTQHSR